MNKLPPECIQHILSFLPLRDLLRSHEVCKLWASHQRPVCANRRQVTICIGDDAISLIYKSPFRMPYEDILDPSTPGDCEPRLEFDAQNAKDNFDLLQFDWLDSVTCDELVSLLPNVTELKVAVRKVPSEFVFGELSWGRKSVFMNQIISLVTRWQSTLAAFALSIRRIDYKQRQIDQDNKLFCVINQLNSLQRLTIELNDYNDVNNSPGSIGDIEQLQFPVLPHLEQLSFLDYRQNLAPLLGSLNKHIGPKSKLKRISLGNVHHGDICYDQMGHWMRNVVHFPDLRISEFNRNKELILDNFSQLEYITIEVHSLVKIPQLLKNLESLLQLTYLEMELKNSNSKYSKNDDMNDDEWDEIDRPPVPIVDPCLLSVRVLMIYASDLNHNDLHLISWSRILPNLEILHYDNSPEICKICSIEYRRQRAIMNENQERDLDRSLARCASMLRHDCTKKLLSPWTRCPRIRRIYSGSKTHLRRWNLSELRQYLGDE